MMCEHEFVQEEWIVEVCKKCDKLRVQTVFEAELAAAKAELAAEKSRVAALTELIEEQGVISEKILRLAEATDKDNLGLKKFIETTSLETKDWLNGLGIVHDCGWRDAILDRMKRMERALKAWQQWEADWIMSNECWDTPSGLPRLNQELMDKMTGIQGLREAALEGKQ